MKVRDMMSVMQFIEGKLNSKLPELDPRFILVGSIVEGTRMHSADELDITMQFKGLQECPLIIGHDPFILRIDDPDNHPLGKWCYDGILRFELFLANILHDLVDIIGNGRREIEEMTNHRISIKSQQSQHILCDCGSDSPIMSHCSKCLPNVTLTKIGACLIFEWRENNIEEVLTIDLIPVLPVKGKNLNEMIHSITNTLIIEKPPNWLKYLTGFINRDRILPESYEEEYNQHEVIEVGMKLLHWGSERNFIIRPAQQLSVAKEFSGNRPLMMVYCSIKCLKSLLKVDISSYFVKKVLLTNEMKENIGQYKWGLWHALHHPELKVKFENVIDYTKWIENQTDIPVIPEKIETSD